MATTDNPTYAAALAYVARGFRVIPIHSAHNGICSCHDGQGCPDKMTGKHPVREKWQTANQPGEPAMRGWWDNDRPKNIGIATGDQSELLVVDVDGEAGIASMKALVAEHGRDWLETYRPKTGGGGWHFYFHMDPAEKIGNSAGTKLGKGIDTRGNGGYVIAPPSVSKKGAYTIADPDKAILEAPEWLLALLRPKERQTTAETGSYPSTPLDSNDPEQRRLDGYTKAAVEHEVGRLKALHPEVWDGNPWDNTTFEVACNLIQLANAPWSPLTPGQAEAYVYENAPRDDGFDLDRIQAKIDSARKKVGDTFTPVPEKPVDLLEFFAGSDLNASPITENSGPAAPTSDMTQGLSDDKGSGNDDDEFVTNVGEPTTPVQIDIPTWHGIPVLHDRLDPTYVEKAVSNALDTKYRAGAQADVELKEIEVEIRNLIDTPSREGDPAAIGEFHSWLERNLQSSDIDTFWRAVETIKAGLVTDGPTIVFKGGGAILASLAATLKPTIGEDEETMLFGPRVSTREVDGPQIIFAFGDEPCPSFDALAVTIEPDGPLETPDESEEIAVRLPDYRALQLERARLGLAPRRREAVIIDAEEDAS